MSGEMNPSDNADFFQPGEHCDETQARCGTLVTGHQTFQTPCFLPIATHGTLRAMTFEQAAECGTQVIMCNGWHIFRESGPAKLEEAGGIHGLIGWDRAICTDSGGYQVFSMSEHSRITDKGVSFSNHGNEMLTPEKIVQAQKRLGSDIAFVLDDCAPYPSPKQRVLQAVERTTLWAKRSMDTFRQTENFYDHAQVLYGIVQGGVSFKLRSRSIREVSELGYRGYGIGGLSIGMPRSAIRDMTSLCSEELPEDCPRHLLGVGLPDQILQGIADGADTFDCVLPIRKGQRGIAYGRRGEIRYKRPQPESLKDSPLEESCPCATCQQYTREQLRLLFKEDKPRAGELASIHNITFFHLVLSEARQAIEGHRFPEYLDSFLDQWNAGE